MDGVGDQPINGIPRRGSIRQSCGQMILTVIYRPTGGLQPFSVGIESAIIGAGFDVGPHGWNQYADHHQGEENSLAQLQAEFRLSHDMLLTRTWGSETHWQ